MTQPSPEALRQAIRETRKLTQSNFAVNITLLPTINPPDYAGYARAAVEEGVRIFETAGNNRKAPLLAALLDIDFCPSTQVNILPQGEPMHRDP